jgi:hypothetical protein
MSYFIPLFKVQLILHNFIREEINMIANTPDEAHTIIRKNINAFGGHKYDIIVYHIGDLFIPQYY